MTQIAKRTWEQVKIYYYQLFNNGHNLIGRSDVRKKMTKQKLEQVSIFSLINKSPQVWERVTFVSLCNKKKLKIK
jgi:hypothetical protein